MRPYLDVHHRDKESLEYRMWRVYLWSLDTDRPIPGEDIPRFAARSPRKWVALWDRLYGST